MKVGDLIFYCDGLYAKDYSVVTKIVNGTHWAYWVKEKQILTFSPSMEYYTKVGPSILGRWND